jgi:hypothetical protein
MKTAIGSFLFVLLSVVSLGGCIRSTGPCYGVGCHAFLGGSGGQSKASQRDSGKKPGHAHKLLKKVKL